MTARLILVALLAALASAHADHIGPVTVQPVAAVYLVSDGGGTTVDLTVTHSPGAYQPMPRFLLRVYDPDEQMIHWRYVEYHTAETLPDVQPADGIELPVVEEPPAGGDVLHQTALNMDQPGVYQVRISTASREVQLAIDCDVDLGYGISCQNGDYLPWPGQPTEAHVWVPPHAEVVQLRGGPCKVVDTDKATLADLPANGGTEIEVAQTETVWRVRFSDAANWSLRASGMPFILCNTEQAARDIHASVEVLDDDTVVCHKFQVRIAEMLPDILSEKNVGRTEDLIEDLADRREAWLADPIRNALLTTAFPSMIEKWLGTQNLDPASHWGGSLDGWQGKVDAAPPENRWDRFHPVEGLRAGASSDYGCGAEHLAIAATYDHPTNPYFGKTQLLYRATAAALRDLMALQEDETWPGIADIDPYPGMMAFVAAQKTFPVFGVAAPHMSDDIRAVWAEGLRRINDRSYPDSLTSARNQSSHYLVSNQAYADGTGDALYAGMARLYGARFLRAQSPAGYDMEACGPCSSYIGMTHYHQAWYYCMSGDPSILQALRNSYTLFNHTVGPEPDGGRMLGGFNFNHRVGEGFYLEQYSGAKGLVDSALPEVGVWAGPPPTEEELVTKREAAAATIDAFLDDPKPSTYPWAGTTRYLNYAEPDRTAVFPCQQDEPFIRTFADEFIFVKRPAYYVACYVGSPAGPFYIRHREDYRKLFADDAETSGGELADIRKCTPFGGGGLTGIWTEEYGHSLMAANWSPSTHHGLVGTDADGLRWWEDYHAHEHMLDEAAGTLTVTGRLEGHPISYERIYTFGDEALGVQLTLTADENVDLVDLVENIPVARGEWKQFGATIEAAGATEGEIEADAFTVSDDRGAGIEVTFDGAQNLRLIPEGLKTSGWRKLQFGRVEVVLPARLQAGQTHLISYTITPLG